MKRLLFGLFAAALALFTPPAAAQSASYTYGWTASGRWQKILVDDDGTIHVTCLNCAGGGGGGGGAITAASNSFVDGFNPDIGSNADSAWVSGNASLISLGKANVGKLSSMLGAFGSPTDAKSTATDTTSASMISLLKGQIDRDQAIINALNSPFQSGGSIGNTAFGAKLQDGSGAAFGTAGNPVNVVNPGSPKQQPVAYTLISNGTASGSTQAGVQGDGYVVDIRGTFGGATATFQASDATGTLQNVFSCTAVCTQAVNIGQGSSIRVVLTGGSPTGIYAVAQGMGGPAGAPSSAIVAGENHIGQVGGSSAVAAASFTRPADTIAYSVGDLVANSTTAGSVVPVTLPVARIAAGTGQVLNIRLGKSSASLTNATFRVHLFKMTPTTTAGDNAAFAGAVNGIASVYIGYVDITMDVAFSDGAKGSAAAPSTRQLFVFDAAAGSTNIYALIEARAAYTPVSGETFTVAAEVIRD